MPAYSAKIHSKRRPLRTVLILVLLIVILLLRGEQLMSRAALHAARAKASALASAVLQQSAQAVLDDMGADSLLHVTCDEAGRVRLIQTDTIRLNQLSTRIGQQARQRLADQGSQELELPLSTALGLTFVPAAGPMLHIGLKPIGTVSASLSSSLAAAGINQTRHTVMLHLACTISLTLPAAQTSVTAGTDLVIADNIIVGDVPQTLLSSDGRLNLSP